MKKIFKQFISWGWICVKKGLVLLIPILFVAMHLFDITIMAKHHYPENISVLYLQILSVIFYVCCIWCILFKLNKWNKALLLVSLLLIIGMFYFNHDIKRIKQHSECIENSNILCPEGVDLKGG